MKKNRFRKELANQYLGLIEILQEIPRITFDHTEILQIKLWMKISFRRMVLEPRQRLVHMMSNSIDLYLKKLIYLYIHI